MDRREFLVGGIGSIAAMSVSECAAHVVRGMIGARELLPNVVDDATSYPVQWVSGDGATSQELKIKNADLPLTWDSRTGFIVECAMEIPGGSFNKYFFQRSYGGTGIMGFSNTWKTIRLWNGKGNYGRFEFSGKRITANVRHKFELTADGNCYVDDDLWGTTDKANPQSTYGYDIQIFLQQEGYYWTDPIYRFKITHDDVVQADFQPWYDNGIYGFKELLSEKFFGNEHIVGHGRIKM